MNPPCFATETSTDMHFPVNNCKASFKLYLNKREKLEQKHESELIRCKAFLENFIEKHRNNVSSSGNFNKVLEVVKVPFTSLPSFSQIKAFFQNYITRERRRKYLKKGLWNEKELKLLLWALTFYSESVNRKIDEFLDNDWQEISQLFPNTCPLKCKAKWFSIKKSKFMRTKWIPAEDTLLLEMMQKLPEKGKVSWNDLASAINGSLYSNEFIRTGRHCRDRWVHHLNPKLSRVQWSSEEDLRIVQYVLKNGKKWANLAKNMENRNEDSIRNRFIKLIKNCKNKEKLEKSFNKTKDCLKPEGKILTRLISELVKNSQIEEEFTGKIDKEFEEFNEECEENEEKDDISEEFEGKIREKSNENFKEKFKIKGEISEFEGKFDDKEGKFIGKSSINGKRRRGNSLEVKKEEETVRKTGEMKKKAKKETFVSKELSMKNSNEISKKENSNEFSSNFKENFGNLKQISPENSTKELMAKELLSKEMTIKSLKEALESNKSLSFTNNNGNIGLNSRNPLNFMNEMWEHLAFQNQMLYQEMYLQRMRMSMNNYLWSSAMNNSFFGVNK